MKLERRLRTRLGSESRPERVLERAPFDFSRSEWRREGRRESERKERQPAKKKEEPRRSRAVLYVEYYAVEHAGEIEARFGPLTDRVGRDGVAFYRDGPSMAEAWKLRKAGEPLLHGVPGARKPITFVEDNAVPPGRLPEFVRRFRAIVERHGTRAAFYAHASVGVLHVRPMLDIHDAEDRDRLRAIAVEVADLAKDMGGVMSGEHGDGRVRSPLLDRYFGDELIAAFREIKAIFDPKGLMNPGNIVDPAP